jgi:hypothetical protein
VLKEALVVKSVLECIYEGTATVSIDKQPRIPASRLASLVAAEATATSGFSGIHEDWLRSAAGSRFDGVSWTATIEGTPFGGIGANKGTTGYGVGLSGKPGISVDERLIRLGMAGGLSSLRVWVPSRSGPARSVSKRGSPGEVRGETLNRVVRSAQPEDGPDSFRDQNQC